MKRNNFYGVWHRCRICGTVFSDTAELRQHLETHKFKTAEFTAEHAPDDELELAIPTVVHPSSILRHTYRGGSATR